MSKEKVSVSNSIQRQHACAREKWGGGCRGEGAPALAPVQVASLSRHARFGRLSRALRGKSARSG